MEIIETRTSEAFTALRHEWDELLARCKRATIFQSWEWNEAWWRHFGQGKHLLLLQVRERGRLVGLAPFCISRYPGTPLRRLEFVGTGISDYLDILASTARATEVCAALGHYLATSRAYDLGDLQDLRPTAVLREAMQGSTLSSAVATAPELTWVDQEACLSIALPSTWEAYLARLGKKMRKNVPYYSRLLQRRCEGLEIGLAQRAQLPAAMSALFELHQKRWQGRRQREHLGNPQVQAFHRQIADRFYERDWLRLHYMRVGDRCIAIEYAFCFRDRYSTYLSGFDPDPEWQHYSIGTVMNGEVLRQAIAERYQVVDFLRGKDAYKMMWAPTAEAVNGRLLLRRRHSARACAMLWLDDLPSRMAPVIETPKRIMQLLQVARDTIVPAKRDTCDAVHAG
jgi:CelD/BcsL family acetyltransferase involved in cellulose biosynthesis